MQRSQHCPGPSIPNAAPATAQLLWRLKGAIPQDPQAHLLGRGCRRDHWGRQLCCCRSEWGVLRGGIRHLSTSFLPFHISASLPQLFLFLSLLLRAPPCRQTGQRCYKQDMVSLEICKREWLKVFNSIPAVNRDKGGSAAWSGESVSDGVTLPCRLFTETGNKYFFGFCQRKISLKMC